MLERVTDCPAVCCLCHSSDDSLQTLFVIVLRVCYLSVMKIHVIQGGATTRSRCIATVRSDIKTPIQLQPLIFWPQRIRHFIMVHSGKQHRDSTLKVGGGGVCFVKYSYVNIGRVIHHSEDLL